VRPWRRVAEGALATVAEAGIKGYEADIWMAILGPRGLSPEIVATVYRETSRILRTPESEETLLASGAEVSILPPEQFGPFMQADYQKWLKVIAASGTRVN
jgi:tripartite-type tricarboxylate transporter receptor subunit TctC